MAKEASPHARARRVDVVRRASGSRGDRQRLLSRHGDCISAEWPRRQHSQRPRPPPWRWASGWRGWRGRC